MGELQSKAASQYTTPKLRKAACPRYDFFLTYARKKRLFVRKIAFLVNCTLLLYSPNTINLTITDGYKEKGHAVLEHVPKRLKKKWLNAEYVFRKDQEQNYPLRISMILRRITHGILHKKRNNQCYYHNYDNQKPE